MPVGPLWTIAARLQRATIIWPASGVALCGLLLRGRGIWLGSFSVNLFNTQKGLGSVENALPTIAVAAAMKQIWAIRFHLDREGRLPGTHRSAAATCARRGRWQSAFARRDPALSSRSQERVVSAGPHAPTLIRVLGQPRPSFLKQGFVSIQTK